MYRPPPLVTPSPPPPETRQSRDLPPHSNQLSSFIGDLADCLKGHHEDCPFPVVKQHSHPPTTSFSSVHSTTELSQTSTDNAQDFTTPIVTSQSLTDTTSQDPTSASETGTQTSSSTSPSATDVPTPRQVDDSTITTSDIPTTTTDSLASTETSLDSSTSDNGSTSSASITDGLPILSVPIVPAISSSPSPISSANSTATTSHHSSNAGAIAGAVIGALALLAIAAAAFLFIRRRRRVARTAPSAEFMHMVRSNSDSPILVSMPSGGDASISAKGVPLSRQGSEESFEELPPPFTSGNFSDPVLEKVHESAVMRAQYQARDAERSGDDVGHSGYGAAPSGYNTGHSGYDVHHNHNGYDDTHGGY